MTGDVSIGELVAVYGYVATLIVPVWFLLEGSHQLIRGRVAARRIADLLNVTPDDVGGRVAGGRARCLTHDGRVTWPRRTPPPTCTTR
ncbi:hypothetical protein NKG94_49550 [Micromonospora sp. M12]